MRVKYSSKELSKAVKNGNKNVIVNLLLDKNMDQPRTKHFDQFGLFKRGTISSNNLTVKKLFLCLVAADSNVQLLNHKHPPFTT